MTPNKQPFYELGRYYLIPSGKDHFLIPQKLVDFRDGCGRCGSFPGCPGLLHFEGGQTICPMPQPGFMAPAIRMAPDSPAWFAMELFAKLLNDSSRKAGRVELWDGRVITFKVEHHNPSA